MTDDHNGPVTTGDDTDRRPDGGRREQRPFLGAALDRRARAAGEALDRRLPILMLLPALALAVGLLAYPVVWAVKLSLHEVSVYNLGAQRFVGLQNYLAILRNPFFYRVLANTAVFVGASVAGQVGLGLGLALLLDREWLPRRLAGAYRATFVLPWAVTGVIVAYSWMFMFEPQVGLVNGMLRVAGVASPPTWLRSVEWAMIALVIANVWQGTPFSLLFLTGGLQSVRRRQREIARVGGASQLQTLRYVTLPRLYPFILMNLVLVTLFTVNVFDLVFVMTGGGPLETTEVLAVHLYEVAFELGQFGRASALAVVLVTLNLAMVATYLLVGRHEGVIR